MSARRGRFTRAQCLDSLRASGAEPTGRNAWEDGTYRFRISGPDDACEVVADRIRPAADANQAMRDALREPFLEARAAGLV